MIIYYRYTTQTPEPVEFGIKTLEKALREKNIPVYLEWLHRYIPGGSVPGVVASVKRLEGRSREAYEIKKEDGCIFVTGYGDVGAMYGLFELAETVRFRGIDSVSEVQSSPFLEKRGIKFNLPFQSYAEGDPFAGNQETVKSWDFWQDYIDFLALNRYNCLSLWSENPFELLLELTKYPDASDVSKDERKRSRDLFTKILKHAKSRGIETYVITWNLRISPGIARGLGLPEEIAADHYGDRSVGLRQHQEVIKDYFREAVKTMMLTFPQLTGIGTSNSEELVGTAEEREQWVVETYLEALKELEYPVPFIHRTNMSNGSIAQDMFLSKYREAPTYISWKYSNAHMYSHPEPRFEELFGAWGDQDMDELNVLYTVRNDDFHNLRGCDAAFISDYIRGMKKPWIRGFYWGADCYIWAGEFQHARNSHIQWEHAYQKQWLQFSMLGRLSYDPELPENRWTDIFASLYGGSTGKAVYMGLTAGVRMLCAVNRLFWIDYDFQWHPETLLSRDGFKTILDFMDGTAMPGVGVMGIKEYTAAQLAGKACEGETPVQIFEMIKIQLASLEAAIKETEADSEACAGELNCILADLYGWLYLGRYYLCKFKAALELVFYRSTGEEVRKAAALSYLEQGKAHWKQLAEVGASHYLPYYMPRVAQTFGWGLYTDEVERDIDLAKSVKPLN